MIANFQVWNLHFQMENA